MSLLELLGLRPRKSREPRNPLAEEIRQRLGNLPPERAEFVAAFAGLLVRVAHADENISPAEREALRRLVVEKVGLAPEEAEAVADIVTRHAEAVGGIEYARLTEAMNRLGTQQDKERLVDCLYAIATAESPVTIVEDEEIRAVARALLLSHSEFIRIRSRYREQLEVLQALRKKKT
ncbi:MAG: hypothetical protein KatS3mg076_2537 [Candidatus Binatia bacterium]|nr:MAG: hypothetical protein KatS3mg076_2537 [Candidatus Binatia bacterium]